MMTKLENLIPIEVKRDIKYLNIKWSDGSDCHITSETLRKNCPCAFCKEQRGDTSHAAPLTPVYDKSTDENFKNNESAIPVKKPNLLKIVKSESAEKSLELKSIWAVGQYAIGMEWGDKHSTGIYNFSLLYELGKMGST